MMAKALPLTVYRRTRPCGDMEGAGFWPRNILHDYHEAIAAGNHLSHRETHG
jgi:hypothetical protein